MTRSVSENGRMIKQFGGISSYDDPRVVPANRAIRAENVTLQNGQIIKRKGFDGWDGDWEQIVAGQIEGMSSFLARDYGDSPPTFRSYGVLKLNEDPAYGFSRFRLWRKPKSGSDFGWESPSNSDIDDDIVSTKTALFTKVGQAASSAYAITMDIPKYDTAAFITDGSARSYKTPVTGAKLWRLGIAAPTVISVNSGGGTPPATPQLFPEGSWEIAIALRNAALAVGTDPGLRSNAAPDPTRAGGAVTLGGTGWVRVVFTAPDAALEPWTNVDVFARRTSAPEETTSRLIATYTHPDIVGAAHVVKDSPMAGQWTVYIHSRSTPGDGPFDFAPLRNWQPTDMRYFCKYGAHGYYARDDEPFVYPTDSIGPNGGGNIECISKDPLGPVDGPVTGLFTYFDQVIVGTPTSLNILTGAPRLQTNQGVWTDANILPGTANFDSVKVDEGPVLQGVGTYVVADNVLYYISRNGLVAYNGRSAFNVSQDIQPLLALFGVDSGGDLQQIMQSSQIVHDPVKHIIYMLVRRDITYAEDTAGMDPAQYVKSRIFCYHYRNKNRETGLGEWTQFDQIGPGALDKDAVESFPDRRDRYSSIAMRFFNDRDPHLCIGHRAPTTEGTPGTYMTYRHAVVLEQFPDVYADSHVGADGEDAFTTGISWRWQGGRADWGIPERDKDFWQIASKVDSNSADDDSLLIGFTVDGAAEQLVAYNPETITNIETPVGWAGKELSIIYAGSESMDDARVLSSVLDLEVVHGS